MDTPYPLEKKNQILGRILSKEITVEQAHREYSIATSCVYRWLRQLKVDSRSGGQGTQAIPLPQGMNFRAALVAEGYCQEVGFESPAAGKFCRTKGVTLDEIKRFCTNGYRMILGMVTLLVLKLARHYLFGVVKESAKKAVRVSIARLRATVILMTAKWSSTMNTVRLTLPSVLPGARELGALFKIPIL